MSQEATATVFEQYVPCYRARSSRIGNDAIRPIRVVIDRHTNGILNDLPPLKWIVFGTWGALIVSLSLTGFLLWRSTQPPLPRIAPKPFETFQSEAQHYLLIPDGADLVRCQDSRGATRPCLCLPKEN